MKSNKKIAKRVDVPMEVLLAELEVALHLCAKCVPEVSSDFGRPYCHCFVENVSK